MNESLRKILEIDECHNDLLDKLDELDAKVQAVLEEWTQSQKSASACSAQPTQS